MTHSLPSEARAPAFGVRVEVEAGKILVQAADSGGRGLPHAAFIVPVYAKRDRLHMIGPPVTSRGDEKGQRDDSLYNSLPHYYIKQPASPYVFEVPLHEWPEAQQVLVLLLYVQAQGIGGLARLPKLPDAAGSPPEILDTGSHAKNAVKRAAEAIRYALETDTLDDLRGGLIVGRPGRSHRSHRHKSDARAVSNLSFALASCQYPSDFLDHMPDGQHATRGPADASLLALGDLLGKPGAPTLLLLAGDQVYIDATAGLFDPKVVNDRFRIPYERRGQSRGVKAVMQRLDMAVEMMLDDHEIRDNWAKDPDPAMRKNDIVIKPGKLAYFRYERGKTEVLEKRLPAHIWRDDLTHNGMPFFLCDTRTERQGRTVSNWCEARIMGSTQFAKLCEWLTKPEHTEMPKFVLTSSAVLPRRREVAEAPTCALRSDAWDGYPFSLHKLLRFVCNKEIKGLVFLSGDEHVSSLVTARVTNSKTGKQSILHCIHSSALYAPYPFANGTADNFQANETFCFPDPDPEQGPYCCEVQTSFAPGDGFALVTTCRRRSHWRLDVKFHDSGGLKENGTFTRDLE
ncbi:alkaline phosphatase D family protein [Mesorhizobium sp. BR1-1-6]|uniref:alkaline phosphatase D family protein n=1 Tax=Mesorhizobium sp. BR1-1-6 TaxID=2876648 RepID=UPI001CD09C91|nr:alkaline phosphatase D family protein [Mesorhizobium sp. BR1-1-6]MBZ9896857.1 alkaline phosphatase D family protein [Mesorhizobium sp. BR1-1-6]